MNVSNSADTDARDPRPPLDRQDAEQTLLVIHHQQLSSVSSFSGLDELANDLTDLPIAIYQYAVRQNQFRFTDLAQRFGASQESLATACEALLRLRVLTRDNTGMLSVVHPDTARAIANEPLSREIRTLNQQMQRNDHQFGQLSDALMSVALPHDVNDIRVIENSAVQGEMDTALLGCTEELLATQPGARPDGPSLRKALSADLDMLHRGVACRLLYQHSARASLELRSAVTRLTSSGGLVRSTSDSLDRMMIADRRIAVTSFALSSSGDQRGAVITHPVVVAFICHIFDRLWASAMTWDPPDPVLDKVSSETRMALLRLMASGLKDEAIAHRLGIAPRTCRRHMAAIMEALGATSRIQAGVKIAQLGVLSPDRGKKSGRTGWIDAHPFSA